MTAGWRPTARGRSPCSTTRPATHSCGNGRAAATSTTRRNWSESSFRGSSPRIAAGARGVFVLYRDSLVGGNVLVRRFAGGQPAGSPVRLAGPAGVSEATIAEDASGALAAEWIDGAGIELRSSTDGTHWSAAQLVAKTPAGGSLSHLALAATADGGGFSAYVANAAGAEGVGRVEASAFGTQRGTGRPGLGQLPGGGIGTPAGDQLATSTCTTAKFGVVTAEIKAGCFLHDPQEPSLDVSLGEIDLNGLRIIPDAGVRIGIDPKFHTLDTTGSVSVVLSGPGIDITIWHGELHVKLPIDQPGFDFSELTAPVVAGFPISGDVNVKLINGGVQVPVSLKLPGAFGGVTGSATLEATLHGGLALNSLEFKVGDANIGALELKDLDISYTREGNVWKGTGTVNVPAGGRLVELTLAIEFDNGAFRSGRFEVGLPYPGVPLDLNDTPPQLYLKKGGLGLGLSPVSLSGTVGLGFSPLGIDMSDRDYAFSLDGSLSFAFGDPITITVTATGFLRSIQISQAKLVYSLPDSVSLTGTSGYDLGVVKEQGLLSAIIDPRTNTYGARMSGDTTIDLSQVGIPSPDPSLLGKGSITISSGSLAINKEGFGIYFPLSVSPVPLSVTYRWTDSAPQITFFKDVTSQFTAGLPAPASDGRRAHAAAVNTFQVPAGTAALDVEATGSPGAPAVVLQTPSGSQIVPSTTLARGEQAIAIADPRHGVTHIGLDHPQAGLWKVLQAPGSQVPVTGVRFALAQAEPVVKATIGGRGRALTLRYRASLPPNVSVTFAEQTKSLLHVIGRVARARGHDPLHAGSRPRRAAPGDRPDRQRGPTGEPPRPGFVPGPGTTAAGARAQAARRHGRAGVHRQLPATGQRGPHTGDHHHDRRAPSAAAVPDRRAPLLDPGDRLPRRGPSGALGRQRDRATWAGRERIGEAIPVGGESVETEVTPTLARSDQVAELAAAARAAGRLGIDTEFMSEGRYRALLCLVQVAVDDDQSGGARIMLIDPLRGDVDVAPLARLLADPQIEIVLHAGRQDVAILRRAWSTEITNIFDTQIAAGFAGSSAQSGYGNLLGSMLGTAGGQDGELHALGQPPADRRAAQLRGRGRRAPARARGRDQAPPDRDRAPGLGPRGMPPARVGDRRARPRERLGAPAAHRAARSALASRGPGTRRLAGAHGLGGGPPGRFGTGRPRARRGGQAAAGEPACARADPGHSPVGHQAPRAADPRRHRARHGGRADPARRPAGNLGAR